MLGISQKDKNLKMLQEENAQLSQTVADLKNQVTHQSPTVSPDSNNATRKLQDEINTLTKRNCGKSLLSSKYVSSQFNFAMKSNYEFSSNRIRISVKVSGSTT